MTYGFKQINMNDTIPICTKEYTILTHENTGACVENSTLILGYKNMKRETLISVLNDKTTE